MRNVEIVRCQTRQRTKERIVSQILLEGVILKEKQPIRMGRFPYLKKKTPCCAAYAFETDGRKMNYLC